MQKEENYMDMLVRRYNSVKLSSEEIERQINRLDNEISQYSSESVEEVERNKSMMGEVHRRFELLELERDVLRKSFKVIVKKDAVDRVSRRVDSLNYEFLINRSELKRVLED